MINGLRTQVVVTFDKPLQPDPALDHTNWLAVWNFQDFVSTAAAAVGSTVVLDGALGGGDPGEDLIHYQPPPSDVITLENARPVLIFADFPLTE